jgi:hypothetical protein
VFVVVGHGRAECAMPLPLYFRGPKAGLPNRGRMFGDGGRRSRARHPGRCGFGRGSSPPSIDPRYQCSEYDLTVPMAPQVHPSENRYSGM